MKTRHTTSLIILFLIAVVYANRQLQYTETPIKLIVTLIACGLIGGLLLATLIGNDEEKAD